MVLLFHSNRTTVSSGCMAQLAFLSSQPIVRIVVFGDDDAGVRHPCRTVPLRERRRIAARTLRSSGLATLNRVTRWRSAFLAILRRSFAVIRHVGRFIRSRRRTSAARTTTRRLRTNTRSHPATMAKSYTNANNLYEAIANGCIQRCCAQTNLYIRDPSFLPCHVETAVQNK
jgi:hypothetical protein